MQAAQPYLYTTTDLAILIPVLTVNQVRLHYSSAQHSTVRYSTEKTQTFLDQITSLILIACMPRQFVTRRGSGVSESKKGERASLGLLPRFSKEVWE
jgi:hypothetical protein